MPSRDACRAVQDLHPTAASISALRHRVVADGMEVNVASSPSKARSGAVGWLPNRVFGRESSDPGGLTGRPCYPEMRMSPQGVPFRRHDRRTVQPSQMRSRTLESPDVRHSDIPWRTFRPVKPMPPLMSPAPNRLRCAEPALHAAYGPRRWRRHLPPLDELILTVLSQHTSDANTARAFQSLRARFPTWEAVRSAPTTEVADAIRSGGLADLKAPRIQAILDSVLEERGTLDVDHLAGLPLDEARRWLVTLNGVGPKTAACVLLFSLGKPALPVDTHVHRVAKRLGLIGPEVSADQAHAVLEAALGGDRDRVYAFHVNMIAHGRALCTARRPFCERCPLTGCCEYYAEHATARSGAGAASGSAPSGGGGNDPLPGAPRANGKQRPPVTPRDHGRAARRLGRAPGAVRGGAVGS